MKNIRLLLLFGSILFLFQFSDEELDWSPDGQQIVFHSRDSSGNHDLYLINADGSGRRRLTDHEAYDGYPRWVEE